MSEVERYRRVLGNRGCSGLVGAQSVLLGGCASKVIVKIWINGTNTRYSTLLRPTPVLFIVGMIVSVIMQTHLLNKAMMAGDNMTVIPVFNAFWTLFGVQGGVVFYQQGSINFIGVVFMFIGVALLSQHKSARVVQAVDSV